MKSGKPDPKKNVAGKMKVDNNPPEFFDSISSSLSGTPFLSGMMMNKGSGNNSSGGFHPKPPDPVALTSLFKSVKKGVQTGVTAAVKAGQDTRIRFSLEPFPGDPGFVQWKDAMKMVARLPEGVPEEFRKKLWLTLSEKYLSSRGVDWTKAERFCFNEWSNPDDDELGMQIVRDLHRTGCSLFCGEDAEANQLMLKRVLLAYARWNKSIGYCQGFNMLAALILEVMDKQESESLQVMIFMIEGILPECYFTNNLRGLSVDMAVFRDLLKLRLPKLSKHLDDLQRDASDGNSGGTSYEPPLTNVFTMQWFLTLFSTCLPRETVLRVWDLILLEGNEVLLRTALAIWTQLEDRILTVRSADEFYCAMGQLSTEMLEYGVVDTNRLVKILVEISPFPFPEVSELREKYTYNITPWSQGLAVAKRGLKILYSDEEDNMDEDEEKIAVAATFGISAVFNKASPRCSPSKIRHQSATSSKVATPSPLVGPSQQNVDKERLSVDINALKHQYAKLRQRQKQAHIILTSGWTRQLPMQENGGPTSRQGGTRITNAPPVAMNHLLLGKKPLINAKPRKPPHPGAIPAPKHRTSSISSERHRTNSSSSSGTTSTSMDATHYTCPQPEIVPPSEHRRHKHRSRQGSLISNQSQDEKSQLSEADSNMSRFENGNEIREISESEDPSSSGEGGPPSIVIVQDQSELGESNRNPTTNPAFVMRGSRSSCDVSRSNSIPVGSCNKTRSENDLPTTSSGDDDDRGSQLTSMIKEMKKNGKDENNEIYSTEKNRQFMEEILREFDKSNIGNKVEETSDEKTSSTETLSSKRNRLQQGRQNSQEAMKLIKENSEILERLSKRHGLSCDATSPPALTPSPTEPKESVTSLKTSPKSSFVTQSSSANKPITFNPFPNRQRKKPKEVGLKLGLYPAK